MTEPLRRPKHLTLDLGSGLDLRIMSSSPALGFTPSRSLLNKILSKVNINKHFTGTEKLKTENNVGFIDLFSKEKTDSLNTSLNRITLSKAAIMPKRVLTSDTRQHLPTPLSVKKGGLAKTKLVQCFFLVH